MIQVDDAAARRAVKSGRQWRSITVSQVKSASNRRPSRQSHFVSQLRIIQAAARSWPPGRPGRPARRAGPVTPSLTVYGTPPIRLAITGMPAAIASTEVMLSPSWAIVGTRQISAAR